LAPHGSGDDPRRLIHHHLPTLSTQAHFYFSQQRACACRHRYRFFEGIDIFEDVNIASLATYKKNYQLLFTE
jgi:hypothetical protein